MDEDLTVQHAIKAGGHDAVKTVVHYGALAAIVAVGSIFLLDKRTRKRLAERWL